MRPAPFLRAALLSLLFISAGSAAAESRQIVVTLKPLHSLVQGVMGETGKAELLVSSAASVHGFSLKPSQVRALQGARAVIYIDETMEEFMKNALLSLPPTVKQLPLAPLSGMTLLERRSGGAWDDHDHDHAHGADHHTHKHTHEQGKRQLAMNGAAGSAYAAYNLHLWLDPENAIVITNAVTAMLSELFPENEATYRDNAARQIARLKELDDEIRARLSSVRDVPFVVLHDAYPYFEARYGLRAVGSLTIEPDAPASARRLADIRAKLKDSGARCLFREPQFSDRLLLTAAEDLPVRIGVLDPLGADIAPDEALYFSLLMQLTDNLLDCLKN